MRSSGFRAPTMRPSPLRTCSRSNWRWTAPARRRSDARPSRSWSTSGTARCGGPSWSRPRSWAPRSTSAAPASRWTRATSWRSARPSSATTTRAGCTAVLGSSTGVRAASRRSATWRSTGRSTTTSCTASLIPSSPATTSWPSSPSRTRPGRPALEARELVVRDLEAGGFLVGTEPYTHEVGHCDRCGTVLEPLVSEQWFLNMDELARMCIAASEAGLVRWHPERFERTYLDWLRGIRDWCVSRQLWLGHRIPVWYCPNGHRFADAGHPGACRECGSGGLTEDPDVLDTWFSSALWPIATLGWPEDTEDLRSFYPTSVNSTDRGIINLWVTRMIISGLFFMGAV